MYQLKHIGLAILLLLALSDTLVFGQAYCNLRDPETIIYDLYPDATSYKSIVRTVDENVRQHVSANLPFSIHFNELGKHTLYIPVKDSKPLGIVHVRSESGSYGLSEIVWSLTPNMEVRDFEFQRCRSRARHYVESDEFKKQIIGMRFNELKALLDSSGQQIAEGKLKVNENSKTMASALIRSALKTIAVSRSGWKREIAVVQPLFNVSQAFPNVSRVQKVTQPYNSNVTKEFDRLFVTPSGNLGSSLERESVVMLRGVNPDGKVAGHVVKTRWKSKEHDIELWWTVEIEAKVADADSSASPSKTEPVKVAGEVVDVQAEEGWPNAEIKKAFREVVGLDFESLGKCSTMAQIAGAEILLLAKFNQDDGR